MAAGMSIHLVLTCSRCDRTTYLDYRHRMPRKDFKEAAKRQGWMLFEEEELCQFCSREETVLKDWDEIIDPTYLVTRGLPSKPTEAICL